jgi:hypothetical protein
MISPDACRNSARDLVRRAVETIDLVGSALRLAGWGISERCRTLRESLLEPLRPSQLILPL